MTTGVKRTEDRPAGKKLSKVLVCFNTVAFVLKSTSLKVATWFSALLNGSCCLKGQCHERGSAVVTVRSEEGNPSHPNHLSSGAWQILHEAIISIKPGEHSGEFSAGLTSWAGSQKKGVEIGRGGTIEWPGLHGHEQGRRKREEGRRGREEGSDLYITWYQVSRNNTDNNWDM